MDGLAVRLLEFVITLRTTEALRYSRTWPLSTTFLSIFLGCTKRFVVAYKYKASATRQTWSCCHSLPTFVERARKGGRVNNAIALAHSAVSSVAILDRRWLLSAVSICISTSTIDVAVAFGYSLREAVFYCIVTRNVENAESAICSYTVVAIQEA